MASNLPTAMPPNLVPKPEDIPNAPYQPDPMKQLQPIGNYKPPLNGNPATSPDAQMLAAPKAPSDKTTDFYRWVDDLKPEERKVMFPMRGLPAMPGASEARAFIDPEHPLTAPYNFYSMLEEPAKWYGKGVQWLHDNVFGGEPGVVEQHKALMKQADALRARGISPMSDDGYRKAAMDVAVNMVGGFGGVIKKLPSPGWAKFFGEQYPIAENPTLSELRIMAKEQHRMAPTEQSKAAGGMGYVRVLQADGRTWAWPADAALHEDVRAKVGIKTQGFDYRDVLGPDDFASDYIKRFLPGYVPGPAYDLTGFGANLSGGEGVVQTLGEEGQDTLAGVDSTDKVAAKPEQLGSPPRQIMTGPQTLEFGRALLESAKRGSFTSGSSGLDNTRGGAASDFLLPTLHQQRVASNIPAGFPNRGAEIISQAVAQQDSANNAGLSPASATAIATLPPEHVAATYDAMNKAESSAQLLSEQGGDAASDRAAGENLIHQGRPWAGYERIAGRKDPSLTAKVMDVLTGIVTFPVQWYRSPSFIDQMGEFERLRHEGHDPFTDPEMQQKALDLVLQMNFGGVIKGVGGAAGRPPPSGYLGAIRNWMTGGGPPVEPPPGGPLTLYHGAETPFAPEPGAPLGTFDPGKIGTSGPNKGYGHGFFLTEREGLATGYAKGGSGEGKGATYTVEVKPERTKFLDRDKAFEDQTPEVKAGLNKLGVKSYDELASKNYVEPEPVPNQPDYMRGTDKEWRAWEAQTRAREVQAMTDARAKASAQMHEAGIPGITMQVSNHGKSDMIRNYVVFDKSDLKIIARDGEKLPPEGAAQLPSDVTPRAAASLSESGRAPTISSAVTPPGTHLPFFQDSTRPLISGSSTSRQTTPLATDGSIRTFNDFPLGSTDTSSGRNVLQGTGDYKALLDRAKVEQPAFQAELSRISSGIDGASLVGTRAKDLPGMEAKVEQGRPPQTVSDYLGGRIAVKDEATMRSVANALQERFGIVEAEDFLDASKGGYRAVHVQVDIGNGMSAEVELVPTPIAAVQEQAHALRQPWKRVTDVEKLSREDKMAMARDNAAGRKLFDDAWSGSKFYNKPTMTAVDFRKLSIPEATSLAMTEAHIIPKKSGEGFIGAPPSLKTYADITAMRSRFDEAVQKGLPWTGWYRKGRLGNEYIAGPDPAAQSMLARMWAMFSWQHSPEQAFNDAIRSAHQHMTDAPIRGGTPEQNRMAGEALASGDPSRMELGLKSEPYYRALNPGSPWPQVGINDRHMARLYGWERTSGPGGGSAQAAQHAFMDGENILGAKRANDAGMGGRNDWTPAEIQELGWFAQRGKTVGTALYESKQNINPETGEHILTLEKAIDKATMESAQTSKLDYVSKYSMNMTGEQIPGAESGHLTGIVNAPVDVRQKYNDAAKWMKDVQGRDMLAGRVGSWVRKDSQATGLWQGEINPVTVNHPLVAMAGRKGNISVDPNSQGVVDTLGWLKAYVDVQHGEGSNIPIFGNDSPYAPGYYMEMPHPTTAAQQTALDHMLNAQDLFHVDNGDSVVIMPHETGNPAAVQAAIENGLEAKLKAILPESKGPGQRVGIGGGLVGPGKMLRADRQGSGEITRALFDQLRKYPKIMEAIDQGSEVAQKARDNLLRDEHLWRWEEGGKTVQAGPARADFVKAWTILSTMPKPLQALWEALQSGEVLLPAIAVAGIFGPAFAKKHEEEKG